ncbi:MAG: signal peptide peptidase SppA [Aquificae bacterium]|nr:signal peptide peptidase SppA [Aquificota bacterium]
MRRLFRLLIICGAAVMVLSGAWSVLKSKSPVGKKVAVLRLSGVIVNPYPLARRIEELKDKKSVVALVLRVDSPGGSVGASQELYRSIERFKETGKPVVVSMGNVAASGGYYVSSAADFIVANPGTITGSIGVLVTHVAYRELLEKLGIKATTVKTGKFKDTLSPFRELTEEEKQYLQRLVNESLEQFIRAILKYRKDRISEEQLRRVADGRIILGQQALELGLVDGLGNLQDAIEKAKELANAPDAVPFYYKEERPFLKRLMGGSFEELKILTSHAPLYYLMEF